MADIVKVLEPTKYEPNGMDETTNARLLLLGYIIWWGFLSESWRIACIDKPPAERFKHPYDQQYRDKGNPYELANAILHKR